MEIPKISLLGVRGTLCNAPMALLLWQVVEDDSTTLWSSLAANRPVFDCKIMILWSRGAVCRKPQALLGAPDFHKNMEIPKISLLWVRGTICNAPMALLLWQVVEDDSTTLLAQFSGQPTGLRS